MANKDGDIGTLVEEHTYQDRNNARKDKVQPIDFPNSPHSTNVYEVRIILSDVIRGD